MEAKRIEKVCIGCVRKGTCKRFPEYHEDTECFDCSMYSDRADKEEGNETD